MYKKFHFICQDRVFCLFPLTAYVMGKKQQMETVERLSKRHIISQQLTYKRL